MPTLTITMTTAQAARVSSAFGKQLNTVDGNGNQRNATTTEVKEQVIQFIKEAVLSRERQAATKTAEASVLDIPMT